MSKPIAPTPPLKGKAALDFIAELEKEKKHLPKKRSV